MALCLALTACSSPAELSTGLDIKLGTGLDTLSSDLATAAADGAWDSASPDAVDSVAPTGSQSSDSQGPADGQRIADSAATASPTCPICDDDNDCTYDVCQPKTAACSHIPLPATTTCATDGDNCTAEWCNGSGSCVVYEKGDCR